MSNSHLKGEDAGQITGGIVADRLSDNPLIRFSKALAWAFESEGVIQGQPANELITASMSKAGKTEAEWIEGLSRLRISVFHAIVILKIAAKGFEGITGHKGFLKLSQQEPEKLKSCLEELEKGWSCGLSCYAALTLLLGRLEGEIPAYEGLRLAADKKTE